jgi:hypothetical protein
MKKHFITLALIVIAILLSLVGSTAPATGFLVLAVITEIAVWVRLIKWPRWNDIS